MNYPLSSKSSFLSSVLKVADLMLLKIYFTWLWLRIHIDGFFEWLLPDHEKGSLTPHLE